MTGMFLTPLRVKLVDGDEGVWELASPLTYRSSVAKQDFYIPVGFQTDFASVARVPLAYMLFGDTAHAAATVHDYLYRFQPVSRRVADDVFLEAIEASTGMGWLQRRLMWAAVRVFGGLYWKG